jgi:hypothetical protein
MIIEEVGWDLRRMPQRKVAKKRQTTLKPFHFSSLHSMLYPLPSSFPKLTQNGNWGT